MKLIIFDCDGTIADSQHAIVLAMSDTFRASGLEAPPRERVLDVVGLSLAEAIRRLIPEAGAETIRDLAHQYGQVVQELREQQPLSEPLFPGARAALDRLGSQPDTVLGLATGKSMRGLALLLKRERLDHHFSTVQTADTHPSKPHPSMIDAAMAETGVSAENTLMVGDTTFDIEMAHRAGVGSIGVTWGYHPRAALIEAQASVLVDDFADLDSAIDRYFQTIEAVA